MSNDVSEVTTLANFKVENVTHKPKRKQGDFAKNLPKTEDKVSSSEDNDLNVGTVTIESAIKYFASHTKDNPKLSALYTQTALWLSRLRSIEAKTQSSLLKHFSVNNEKSDNPVEEVNNED